MQQYALAAGLSANVRRSASGHPDSPKLSDDLSSSRLVRHLFTGHYLCYGISIAGVRKDAF